jgi:hypothetical protein
MLWRRLPVISRVARFTCISARSFSGVSGKLSGREWLAPIVRIRRYSRSAVKGHVRWPSWKLWTTGKAMTAAEW